MIHLKHVAEIAVMAIAVLTTLSVWAIAILSQVINGDSGGPVLWATIVSFISAATVGGIAAQPKEKKTE